MKSLVCGIGNLKVDILKLKVALFSFLIMIIACIVSILIMPEEKVVSMGITILLMGVIIAFLLSKRRMVLFEPIVLFSVIYIFVCFASFHLLFTDYQTNEFINATTFEMSIDSLFEQSMIMYFVGYICALLGYYLIRTKADMSEIKFTRKSWISNLSVGILTVCFSGIGMINFLVNVFQFAGGDILLYLANVSQREAEFSVSGTTIGYNLLYFAVYLYMFSFLREDKKPNVAWCGLLLIAVVVKASTGRIFSTLVLVGTTIGVWYYYQYSKRKYVKNSAYFMSGVVLGIGGIVFYVLRLISSLNTNGLLNSTFREAFIMGLNKLYYVAFDRGYAPNIALMPKIIESWNKEFGFLFGETLFSSLYGYLPEILVKEYVSPAVVMRIEWYHSVGSGNLPPTGVGEMYINFGIFGPVLGMFFFGVLMALIYNLIVKSKNFWAILIGIDVTLSFVMLYAKNDFSNIPIWNIITWSLYVLGAIVLTQIIRVFRRK